MQNLVQRKAKQKWADLAQNQGQEKRKFLLAMDLECKPQTLSIMIDKQSWMLPKISNNYSVSTVIEMVYS